MIRRTQVKKKEATQPSSARRRAPAPLWNPLVRLFWLVLIAVTAAVGSVVLFLLPDLIGAIPIEIQLALRHPLLKVAVCAVLVLAGPSRLRSAVPGRLRGALARLPGLVLKVPGIAPLSACVRRAVAGLVRVRPGRVQGLADRALAGPLTAAAVAAPTLLLLSWVPHYLTWPWWPDTDQFAVSALSWHAGILPYRDLVDFDFPGPIYLCYALGWAFGWGKTLPFNAADAALVVLLGVALAAWSRRVCGRALPGLVGYLPFLCYYLNLDYSLVGQRDWQGPLFAILGILALEALPGRAGRLASALAVAVAVAYRPQVVLFFPALASAVDEGARRAGEPLSRSFRALVEWSAALAVCLFLAFSPLIAAGLFDDFVHSLRYARAGGHYNRTHWFDFTKSMEAQLYAPTTILALSACLLVAVAGPAPLRRPSRTWVLAVLGIVLYKPISPQKHIYLDQPLILTRSISLALPVAWLLSATRVSAPLRLAAVAAVLAAAVPTWVPRYCNPARSLQSVGPLARDEAPPFAPPGCDKFFHDKPPGYPALLWADYCRLLDYVRRSTSPATRVATFLRVVPFPTVNGPTARLTPFPAAGGFIHLGLVDPDLRDRYVEALKTTTDSIVVWHPGSVHVDWKFRSPQLDKAILRSYRYETRFGSMQVWRHVPPGHPACVAPGPLPGR
jgi:hypothetical protein